jgi:hypothetical protein
MVWWVVDNEIVVLICLFAVAGVTGMLWTSSRKKPLLLVALAAVALIFLVVVLSLVVVTDTMQIAANVDAIRDAANAGKVDDVLQFFEDSVVVETSMGKPTLKRADLRDFMESNKKRHGVKTVETGPVHVDSLQRPNAKTTFVIRTDEGHSGRCFVDWSLGKDEKWRVNRVRVESLVGGHAAPVLVWP